MVIDTLDNCRAYEGLHPHFKAAFDFLLRPDIDALPLGRTALDGDALFANIQTYETKPAEGGKPEAHRRYIDIQYTVVESDLIGWRHVPTCTASKGYDASRDVEFHDDAAVAWTTVPAGHFAVYFPEDAHAPMGTDGQVHKVVVKVAV